MNYYLDAIDGGCQWALSLGIWCYYLNVEKADIKFKCLLICVLDALLLNVLSYGISLPTQRLFFDWAGPDFPIELPTLVTPLPHPTLWLFNNTTLS